MLTHDKLNKAFSMFDKDDNGFISLEELKDFFVAEDEAEQDVWDELIKEFDQNNDGLVKK